MPERPPETGAVTVLDVLDGVPGLRLADRDWRALAGMRHPVKVALWLALMRPVEELMSRESFEERLPNAEGSEVTSIPAVIAWAETIARKAIRGDMQASAIMADRLEGKVGLRKDDVDPEDERRRGDIQAVIVSVVEGLTNAKLSQPGDDSLDITPIAQSPHDNERQDSDSADEHLRTAHREAQDNEGRGQTLVQSNEEPEERDLSDPLEGPRIVTNQNGRANGHG